MDERVDFLSCQYIQPILARLSANRVHGHLGAQPGDHSYSEAERFLPPNVLRSVQGLNFFQDCALRLLCKIHIPADLEIHPEICGHVEELRQT